MHDQWQALGYACIRKPDPRLNRKAVCPVYRDSHYKDKTVSWDRLIFIMRIPILIRRNLYIEMAPEHSLHQWFRDTGHAEKEKYTVNEISSVLSYFSLVVEWNCMWISLTYPYLLHKYANDENVFRCYFIHFYIYIYSLECDLCKR